MKKHVFVASISLLFIACTKQKAKITPKNVDTSINYAVHIKPIVDSFCMQCHKAGSFYFKKPLNAKEWAISAKDGSLNDRVFVKKDMPPLNAPKLGETDLETLKNWINTGAK